MTLSESLMSFSFIRGVHLAGWGDWFVSVIGGWVGENRLTLMDSLNLGCIEQSSKLWSQGTRVLGSWAQLFNNLVNYYMGTVCKIPMRSSQSFRGSQHPTLLCTFFRIGQLKEQGTPLFFQNGGSGVFSAEDSYHHFIKRHCNAMHCVLSPAICIDGFAFGYISVSTINLLGPRATILYCQQVLGN